MVERVTSTVRSHDEVAGSIPSKGTAPEARSGSPGRTGLLQAHPFISALIAQW
jgi:hypothetical protein